MGVMAGEGALEESGVSKIKRQGLSGFKDMSINSLILFSSGGAEFSYPEACARLSDSLLMSKIKK